MFKENLLLIVEELRDDTFKLENGMYITCSDWNGEKWFKCYQCYEDGYPYEWSNEYIVRPLYVFEEDCDQAELIALEIWIKE